MRRRFANNHKTFDYSKYMTIEALEDGYEASFHIDVEYNLNGHKWERLKANFITPTLRKGDLLSFRCSLSPNEYFGVVRGNGKAINLRGNILSLIFKDDINLDISHYPGVFRNTFAAAYGNNIVSVEKNFLPATTLASNCYYSMFYNCTSLTTAPELPATTLDSSCYSSMFYNCTSLTTAPELPATTLADSCYQFMFENCSKLNYIKMLATDISAPECLYDWVKGVASTGTFVKNPAMTSLPTDDWGIPRGWIVVDDGEEVEPVTFSVQDTEGLITEYIIPYQMTWGEFINSKYNKTLYNSRYSKFFREFNTSEDNGKSYVRYRASVEYCDKYHMLYLSNYNYIYTDELIKPTQYTNM